MRPSIIWTIFRKEITESLRDRLTLAVVVGLPVLIYPLMIMGLTKLQAARATALKEQVSTVAVWGEAPIGLTGWLQSTNTLALTNQAFAPVTLESDLRTGARTIEEFDASEPDATDAEPGILQSAREVLHQRKVDAVVVIWPGLHEALAQERLGKVMICYDSVRKESQVARDRLRAALSDFRRAVVHQRETAHGLPEGFAQGIEVRSRNLAPPQRRIGEVLGMLLPFVIIMLSATGALYASVDLTAGEKDRATMQTLLCAPVSHLEIAAGKFLTVWCVSLIASLANTASIGATIWRASASLSVKLIDLSPTMYVFAFVLLLPATFMVSSIFLAIAMLARDAKDAGNFLGATLMVLMMPMAAVLMPGVELNAWTAFVPLVNLSLLIKAVFLGEAQANTVFLSMLSSFVFAALSLVLAARAFGREQILLGGRGTIRELLLPRGVSNENPTAPTALVTFALVMVLAYYGSLVLENHGLVASLLVTQFCFFLLPVIAVTAVMRFRVKSVYSLTLPPWRGVLAAVLIGLTGWAVVGGLIVRVMPPPDSLVKALEKVVLLEDDQSPLWLAWLMVALVPAVCEETLFRGLILSGLRRWGIWPALLVSSFLFAIAHASIYRLLPTFFLGLLLGWIVLRTGSIFCSMIVHVLNNGLAVTIARSPELRETLRLDDATFVPWSITLPALVVVVVAITILRTCQPRHGTSAT